MRETKIHSKTFSKIFSAFIMAPVISAATVSSNASKVLAQTATLEDILAEIDALRARLDAIEANLAALNSGLSSLDSAVGDIQSSLRFSQRNHRNQHGRSCCGVSSGHTKRHDH